MRAPRITRSLAVLLVAGTLTTASRPQTILSNMLGDVSRYLTAAVSLIAGAAVGADSIVVTQIPKADRTEARDELQRISFAISSLRTVKTPLIVDLSDLVDQLRRQGVDAAQREQAWTSIMTSVGDISGVVRTTLNVVENSRWLKVALAAEDRLKLREVLQARSSILDRLRSIPAPRTPDEINQLDRMNQRSRDLIRSLGELNLALTRAADRLTLE